MPVRTDIGTIKKARAYAYGDFIEANPDLEIQ